MINGNYRNYFGLLPQECVDLIFSYSTPENVPDLACVSTTFNAFAKQLTEKLPLDGFFGIAKWKKYGVDVGETSPVPLKLYRECVQSKGAFLLTFIPEMINEQSLTVKSIDEWLCRHKSQEKSNYYVPLSNAMTDEMIEEYTSGKGRWVLLAKDLDPGTRNKEFAAQKEIIEKAGYAVPNLTDTVVSVFMYNLEKPDEFIFPDGSQSRPWTYTRVEEICNYGSQIVIGGFSPGGLVVGGYYCYGADYIGVARARKS